MKSYNIDGEEKFVAGLYARERDFWLEKLAGDLEKSYFPYDFERTGKNNRLMESVPFPLPEILEEKIIKASNGSDPRLHMILAAGLTQLLNRYTGSRDIVIGVPIYTQEVEGNFVNSVLTLRNRLEECMNFKDLLNRIRQTIIEADEHVNYPVESIPHDLGITYSAEDDFPLFDILILLENIHNKNYIQNIRTNMIFSFNRTGEKLEGTVEYNPLRYDRKTVEKITGYFCYLLQTTIFAPTLSIEDVPVFSDEEKRQLLFDFNNTAAESPVEMTISRLFEKRVRANPGRTAVLFGDRSVTYEMLNEQANRIAAILIEKGVAADTIVGIMGKRSPWLIAAILGILKSGGAYLPIDAASPEGRIRFLLEDSKARVLITQAHLKEENPSLADILSPEYIILIEDLVETAQGGTAIAPEPTRDPGDIMYSIYTSGTTGKPKCVLVFHRGVVNYIWWAARTYVRDEPVNFPFYTSIAFDLTVTSIFTPLITGNAVVVFEGESNRPLIEEVIDNDSVGAIKLTPSHLKLLKYKITARKGTQLKRLILGGEDLETSVAREIHEKFKGDIEIYNEYGPTEATVGCMIHRYDPKNDTRESVPIGTPIANSQVYLLNDRLEPVPVGALGELYISGVGIAAGYLHQPRLTEEKFIPNPFVPGTRMYRTGDLARRLIDGTIEFSGRIDDQVKIRGYRIEMGEIENRLAKHPGIKEAVVLAREENEGDKYLCAYFVSDREYGISELREFLSKELPDYMIPSYFAQMESIPLTSNGKIDRKAFPKPELKTGGGHAAPRNKIEEILVGLWSEILGGDALHSSQLQTSIGINDNFFELGGHSLKAVSIISQTNQAFNVQLPLSTIFANPTIAEFSQTISRENSSRFLNVEKCPESDYYRLSHAQKRLWFFTQMAPESPAYNICQAVRFSGDLNIDSFKRAVDALVRRHESLRTSIKMGQIEENGEMNEEPVQWIHEHIESYFHLVDISHYPRDEKQKELRRIIEKVEMEPFDLSRAPLFRLEVVRLEDMVHVVAFVMHHIISDGLSIRIMIREFGHFYDKLELSSSSIEVQPLTFQYKDFIFWQDSLIAQNCLNSQQHYWHTKLEGPLPVLDIPTDYPRPSWQSFRGDKVTFTIDERLTANLRVLSRKDSATLFMILIAAFKVLLYRYTHQEDILVGILIAGRSAQEFENIIGYFVNILVLRDTVKGEWGFKDFLGHVRETMLGAYDNQDYPFDRLVEETKVARNTGRSPVFDILLVFQNYEELQLGETFGSLKIDRIEKENVVSKYELYIDMFETPDLINVNLEFCVDLYKRESIERMVGHYLNILHFAADSPKQPIAGIGMLSEGEKKELIVDFNNTAADYPRAKTIHELFAEQASRTPDNIAVVPALTYREFHERTNRLAELLRTKGVAPGDIVGIMMERSVEMLTGIFGILTAGATYLPIDPEYPQERIDYMLKDSAAKILLTENEIASLSTGCVFNSHHSNHLAYIIYTSGSTGKPKGVMVEHKSVINRLNWMQHFYPLDETSVILQKTPISFDVSVWELFWWSWFGSSLCLLEPGGEKNPDAIIETVNKNKVTVMHFVPSLLGRFLKYVEDDIDLQKLNSLKQVFSSGEALEPEQVELFAALLHKTNRTRLTNLYGPTEATVDVSYFDCPAAGSPGVIPIGKPIDNIQLYVLDKNMQLQSVGVPGELCIAGDGLARGYMNRVQLTAAAFVDHPFSPGKKLYKTGDLARWLPDGNVEFLGRIDHQVKIRGFRIELGEIQTVLLKHPDVREGVVVVKERENDKFLCAYVVPKDTAPPANLNVSSLRDHLAKSVPRYMIPAYFVQLETIPLTPNGKLDRKSLPDPEDPDLGRTNEFVAPQSKTEKQIAKIWSKLLKLNIDKIGIHDNFFEIGGHSLLIPNAFKHLNKAFPSKLDIADLFDYLSIYKLGRYIDGTGGDTEEDDLIVELSID